MNHLKNYKTSGGLRTTKSSYLASHSSRYQIPLSQIYANCHETEYRIKRIGTMLHTEQSVNKRTFDQSYIVEYLISSVRKIDLENYQKKIEHQKIDFSTSCWTQSDP